jgi:hypothetical protein
MFVTYDSVKKEKEQKIVYICYYSAEMSTAAENLLLPRRDVRKKKLPRRDGL